MRAFNIKTFRTTATKSQWGHTDKIWDAFHKWMKDQIKLAEEKEMSIAQVAWATYKATNDFRSKLADDGYPFYHKDGEY